MITVKFYETATQLRKKEQALGVFRVPIEPVTLPEVPEDLKGKVGADGRDMYEAATERRNKKMEKAIYDCKCAAVDKIRGYVGTSGVLVATDKPEVSPEKKMLDEIVSWIYDHEQLTADFEKKFPKLVKEKTL